MYFFSITETVRRERITLDYKTKRKDNPYKLGTIQNKLDKLDKKTSTPKGIGDQCD